MSVEAYEVGHGSDKRGVNLISDAYSYSPLWYRGANSLRDAIDYAEFNSCLHDVLIRVYDEGGNVIFAGCNNCARSCGSENHVLSSLMCVE